MCAAGRKARHARHILLDGAAVRRTPGEGPTLIDDVPVGLVRLDPAGRIVEANAAFTAWAETRTVTGRLLEDLLVETEDFRGDPTAPCPSGGTAPGPG